MHADRFHLWVACKQRIASCRQCLDRWPSRVEATLRIDEIPDPPSSIAFLFVGVAPHLLEAMRMTNLGTFTPTHVIDCGSAFLMCSIAFSGWISRSKTA